MLLLQLIEKEYANRIHDIKYMLPKVSMTYENLFEASAPGEASSTRARSSVARTGSRPSNTSRAGTTSTISTSKPSNYIAHDGDNYGTIVEYFRVNRFKGVKYFTDPAVFPLKYHAGETALRKNLAERGRKFVSLQGQNCKFTRASRRRSHTVPVASA